MADAQSMKLFFFLYITRAKRHVMLSHYQEALTHVR